MYENFEDICDASNDVYLSTRHHLRHQESVLIAYTFTFHITSMVLKYRLSFIRFSRNKW